MRTQSSSVISLARNKVARKIFDDTLESRREITTTVIRRSADKRRAKKKIDVLLVSGRVQHFPREQQAVRY